MTGPADPNSVARLLQRAHLAAHYHRSARARELGLPLIDLTALEHLVVLGPVSPGQLGPRLDLTSGGTTTLLRRMAERGYIIDCPEPRDRRLRPRSATPAGNLLLADFLTPIWRADGAALASLTTEEAALLEDLLGLLVQLREQAAGRTPPPRTGPSIDGEHVKALVMKASRTQVPYSTALCEHRPVHTSDDNVAVERQRLEQTSGRMGLPSR